MTKANDLQVGGTHYKDVDIEPWDVVDTWPLTQRIGYYRGCALKYVMRMGTKDDPLVEVQKGEHLLKKLAEVIAEDRAQRRVATCSCNRCRVARNGTEERQPCPTCRTLLCPHSVDHEEKCEDPYRFAVGPIPDPFNDGD